MRWSFRSVRVRLTIWYVAALATIVLVFSSGSYIIVRTLLIRQVDQRLETMVDAVERALSEGPDEFAELEEHGSVTLFSVVEGDRILYQTGGWRYTGLDRAFSPEPPEPERLWSWTPSSDTAYRLITADIRPSGNNVRITVAEDEQAVRRTLNNLAFTFFIGFPGAITLAFIGGYILAGRVLSPISAMALKARQISAERLSERLPVDNPEDEFGRLALVFNETLGRLDDAFQRLRQFTSNASHELRTPLTAMRSVGEVAVREDLDSTAYRDVIGSMLEEVDRLGRLVENLLILTREGSETAPIHRESVDLAEFVEKTVESIRVLADEKEQRITIEVKDRPRVDIDAAIVRQALMNVLDNAIKYTPPHGHIQVIVRNATPTDAVVEIIDQGPGIPLEHQDKIFDRFYRVEQGRSSATGGFGLGLAIARWAVERHRGRVEVESAVGQGSLFRIVLPVDTSNQILYNREE